MSEELFRQKSIDRIKSPESLNDYIRVSNPGVWILLLSIVVLLIGACVWGFFGHIDSVTKARVHVRDSVITCYVDEDTVSEVTLGMTVKFAGIEGTISEIGQKEGDEYAFAVKTNRFARDGVYDGELVTMRIQPKSLVLD